MNPGRLSHITALSALILFSVAAPGPVRAAGDIVIGFPITISFVTDPVDLVRVGLDTLSFNSVGSGVQRVSDQDYGNPRITLWNRGGGRVNYTARATIAGGWGLGTVLGDTGIDRCVLAAIFTAAVTNDPASAGAAPYPFGRDLTPADFGDEDVLTGTAREAGPDALARNNALPDPDDGPLLKGYNVQGGSQSESERSLRFLLQAPVSDTTGGAQQTITVVLGASVI